MILQYKNLNAEIYIWEKERDLICLLKNYSKDEILQNFAKRNLNKQRTFCKKRKSLCKQEYAPYKNTNTSYIYTIISEDTKLY